MSYFQDDNSAIQSSRHKWPKPHLWQHRSLRALLEQEQEDQYLDSFRKRATYKLTNGRTISSAELVRKLHEGVLTKADVEGREESDADMEDEPREYIRFMHHQINHAHVNLFCMHVSPLGSPDPTPDYQGEEDEGLVDGNTSTHHRYQTLMIVLTCPKQ